MYSITYFILRGITFVFCLFGNLVGLIVFTTKVFKKFPSRIIYIILAASDTINLIFLIVHDFLANLNINWLSSSEITFKLSTFQRCSLMTQYFLVFISAEKYISIRFSNNQIIKKNWFQSLTILIILATNFIVYHSIFYFLNFSFFLFYSPFSVFIFVSNDYFTDLCYNIFFSLAFLNLGDHFYILFCFNSVFRREVLIFFRLKTRYQATNTRVNIF